MVRLSALQLGRFELGAVGVQGGIGRDHLDLDRPPHGRGRPPPFAVLIGLPTLRLRAITSRSSRSASARSSAGRACRSERLFTTGQPHERRLGITPSTRPASDGWLSDKLGLPADFIVENGSRDLVSLIYWSAIGLLLITIFCSLRLRDSRLGRAWIAIREDEIAAAAMGSR